jgi:hypothetical protein
MSRNGSGGYSLPVNSWNPAVNGVSATAADWQSLINDVATALQQSVSADGQTPITGNLAMGGNKLTGLGAGVGTGESLRFEQLFSQGTLTSIASATTTDIGAQLSNFLQVTGTTTITSFGTNYNGPRFLIFSGALLLTHSATLVLPGAANITTVANDCAIAIPISGGWQVVAYQRASGFPVVTTGLRSYLAGLTMSTVGASTTMSIAAGVAQDSTNAAIMTLTAIAKTTAAWAVGTATGGLDTGAIANSTWYHFYVIRRPDTGVVDVVFSLSATSPTLPTNYTQFRRIGSGRTNGSGQWTSFSQYGDTVLWLSPVLDVDVVSTSTTSVLRGLTVPTGVQVLATMNVLPNGNGAGSVGAVLISSPDVTDLAPSGTAAPLANAGSFYSSAEGGSAALTIRTNTSAQIRSYNATTSGWVNLRIATTGWIDTRGKDL